jgi:hypothetical protein
MYYYDTLCAILPDGVRPVEGPALAPPTDFYDGFALPAHTTKPLEERDGPDTRLRFYEVPHVYTYDGVPLSTSVTSLAHQFETPFDGQAAISMMTVSQSQAWPRLEYVVYPSDGLDAWTCDQGALMTCQGRTVACVPPMSMAPGTTRSAVEQALRCLVVPRARVDDEVELHTFARAMMPDEILRMWQRNGQRACNLGTDRHHLAECFFNGLPLRWWEEDMGALYDFCRVHLIPHGIVGHATEKEIVCWDADVAGSIDLIVWDPRQEVYHIVDYKRSDKLQGQLRGFGKMSAPFAHLDSCKGAGYALQLSIYQYILQRDYGMRIGERVLLSLHAEHPFVTSVPYLAAEVEHVMECRMALTRARRAVAGADPSLRCALTGAPLVNAVRLSDGRVVMDAAARVRDVDDAVPDEETRARFDERVCAQLGSPPAFDASVTSWRRQMPAQGILPVFG